MAPEVFYASANPGNSGYSFAVDWWSLGITAFEMRSGRRPYDIHSRTSMSTVLSLLSNSANGSVGCPLSWSPEFTKYIQSLVCVKPERRISSLAALKGTKLMANVNIASLIAKRIPPSFVPRVSKKNR